MEYNTSRSKLFMPEYGRNVQKMVDHVLTIEDKEQRQKNALAIIELMGVLNPHLKNVEDFKHKLWDHIFRISDFKIDIDSPYPVPTKEEMLKKPERLPYPLRNLKNRHIGLNITQIINRAIANKDESKQKGFVNSIAYYMKLSYANWHREQLQDDIIKEEIKMLSGGVLNYVSGDTKAPKFNNGFKRQAGNTGSNNNGQNRNKNNFGKNKTGTNNNFQGKSQKQNNNRGFTQKNG